MNDAASLRGATAVVVGPDPDSRREVGATLCAGGMEVLEASSGLEGLQLAERRPDVVLIDLELTDLSALEVTSTMKLNPLTQTIPVLLRSRGVVSDEVRVQGLAAGADLVVDATVAPATLVALVSAQLRQRELSRQLELALSLEESGVYDWSVASGEVRWTDSLARLHRMRPDEFGGTLDAFVATVLPDDREHVAEVLDAALEEGDKLELSYRFQRADGSLGWMDSRGRVFRSIDGDAIRVLGLAHDVTNRVVERQRIEQLRRLASELTAARTSRRVLDVLRDELDGTSIDARHVLEEVPPSDTGAEEEEEGDTVFAYATSSGRLELVERSDGEHVTRRQAIAIGELAGTALDRALRFEAERSNAVALQRALLPTASPEIAGWWIDTDYVPAAEDDRLGGDFFDVVELGDTAVVVIGDVAGHGLAATTQMGTIRTLLRSLAVLHDGNPSDVLQQARALFDRVCGTSSPFVSACVARCGPDGSVRLASAGHPPPLVRQDGVVSAVELPAGPPLGTFADACDSAVDVSVGPTDWIALYTDGVLERRDRPLADSIAELADDLASVVSASDLVRAGESASGEMTNDDRAAVVVRRTAE